ncbi:MAG: GspH/FimT family protein [Pseudomonadales bacterium]
MAKRGYTLVELLAALTVAAVVLALALPAFHGLATSWRGTAALNQLLGAIASARSLAISSGRVVTLCPGLSSGCLGRNQWHRGFVLFIDEDADGRLDPADRVVTALPELAPGERIYWRSFRNRSYLQFHPRGFTRWQNGSFLYCPPGSEASAARMAVINVQGRARPARDSDGDGIVEDASGRNVRCPP